MTKNRFFLTILAMVATVLSVFATPNEIVVHTGGAGNGYDQIYIEPPYVTYDDNLNELYVYFGSTGTIDIEYLDPTGMPCTLVNGESHAGYTGKATIDGCVFQSGAHVRIDAGKVEISGNHPAQFDAAVQINQYVE